MTTEKSRKRSFNEFSGSSDSHHNMSRKRTKQNFVSVDNRQQMTRKQISEKLHFESFNDENTAVYTQKDQMKLLNKKDDDESDDEIDSKIEKLRRDNNYKKSGKGMLNLLEDLCDLEYDNLDEDEKRHYKHQNQERERIFEINKASKNYKGNLKNILITKDVKNLALETRERALNKLAQIIKENWSKTNKENNDKLQQRMSIQCELMICKKSKNSIEYGKFIRDELQNIRTMTKKNQHWKIELIEEDKDKDAAKDDSDSESESESDSDDDLPINLRLNKS